MGFLEYPHLPDKKVTHVLVDIRAYDKTIYLLEDMKVQIIFCQPCYDVYEAISSHPDIFYFHYKYDLIFAAPNSPTKTTCDLKKLGFNIVKGQSAVCRNYPYDISYNIARVGDNVFHNLKWTDKTILKVLKKDQLKMLQVNQGYTKCSILVVDKNAIITSDIKIHKKAMDNNIDSLLISPGYIKLKGMNYGFIGGCAGLVDKNVMLFNGDIQKHPDFLKIKDFLKKYNIDILYSTNLELSDIGSIIPLCQ